MLPQEPFSQEPLAQALRLESLAQSSSGLGTEPMSQILMQ